MNLSDEMKITIFPFFYVFNFFKNIKEEFKFSVYEQNVLENLLKQFNPNDLKNNLKFIKKLKNGKQVINHLKQKLLQVIRLINTIYVENEIKDHSRTLSILSKFKRSRIIYIHKYSEIFNKKKQSFRLQKKDPLLILAKKKIILF